MLRLFPAPRSATIAQSDSATPPASTSSKRASTGSRTSAARFKRTTSAMKLANVSPDKAAVVARIKAERAIAVIRTDSIDRALRAAEAAVSGGFRAIEITFSFPKASEAIAKLTEAKDDLLIGAGTILTREHVHEAVGAGARFVVSPCVVPEVIAADHELQ